MKQEQITRYQNALKAYVHLIVKCTGHVRSSDSRAIIKEHQVSATIFSDAVKLKIFKRIARGVYSINVYNIEPIDAREVIQYRKEFNKKIIKVYNSPNNIKDDKKINLTNESKTISIFWGLFKIKY